MDRTESAPTPGHMESETGVRRVSGVEVSVSRLFDAPRAALFEARTRPDRFMRWWAPKSMGVPIRSCEMDVRAGGGYRLEFGSDAGGTFAFYGRYLDVVPGARLVWTNEEEPDGAVTTVTFEEAGGGTHVTYRETYPSRESCDEGYAAMAGCTAEQFGQLADLLAEPA